MLKHQGPARVFNSEEESTKAILEGKIKKGDVNCYLGYCWYGVR